MRMLWSCLLFTLLIAKPSLALDLNPVFPSGIPSEAQLFQSMIFPIQQYLEQLRRQSVTQQNRGRCQRYDYSNPAKPGVEPSLIEVCYQEELRPKLLKQVVTWTLNGAIIDSFTWIKRGNNLSALSADELFMGQFSIESNKTDEVEFRTLSGIYFQFQPQKDQKKLVVQFPIEDYILTAHTYPRNNSWVQRILARCTECGPFDLTIQAQHVAEQGWMYHYFMNTADYELKPQDAILVITQVLSAPVGAFGFWLLGVWYTAGMPHF